MKYLLQIILISALLMSSCNDDFEETTFEVITNEEIKELRFSGNVLSNNIELISAGVGKVSEEPISDAIISVYREEELIEETTSDAAGAYAINVKIDPQSGLRYFIQTSKENYKPNIQPINTDSPTLLNQYIEKSADDPDLYPLFGENEIILSGRIKYEGSFYVEALQQKIDGGLAKRVGYFNSEDGHFDIPIRKNAEIELRFLNILRCDVSSANGFKVGSFEVDTDIGLIDEVEIVLPALLTLTKDNVADCLKNGDPIINDLLISIDNESEFLSCGNEGSFRIFIIDYENSTISEVVDTEETDLSQVSFNQCNPYLHEFQLTTDFGIYTQESPEVVILQHRFKSLPVDHFDQVFFLDFTIGEEWRFSARALGFPGQGAFGPSKISLLPQSGVVEGFTVESGPDESSGFEIVDGFFIGSFIGHEEYDGNSLDFKIEFKVPVIE